MTTISKTISSADYLPTELLNWINRSPNIIYMHERRVQKNKQTSCNNESSSSVYYKQKMAYVISLAELLGRLPLSKGLYVTSLQCSLKKEYCSTYCKIMLHQGKKINPISTQAKYMFHHQASHCQHVELSCVFEETESDKQSFL